MKEKRDLILGLVAGAILGWAFFIIGMPFLADNVPFLLSLIIGFCFASLGLITYFIWHKNSFLRKWIESISTSDDSPAARRNNALIWMLSSALIIIGGLASSYVVIQQNDLMKMNAHYQELASERELALVEANRISNLIVLMNNVLDKVDTELKESPDKTLSEETIGRISALSYSFKPYASLTDDSLMQGKLSPERGLLLLALANTNMDSTSFEEIKRNTSFSQADLSGAQLASVNLSGANFHGANFSEAMLENADLRNTNLRESNLWGANLSQANLSKADLNRADMRWAVLNEATLHGTDLSGANMSNAKLRKADLAGADLKWADLSSTFLNHANLQDAHMEGSNLLKANLSDANFTNAEVNKTPVEGNDWFQAWVDWRVIGVDHFPKRYEVVNDRFGRSEYMIEVIKVPVEAVKK